MRHYIHDAWQMYGLVYNDVVEPHWPHRIRQTGIEAHTTILSASQRTTLKQTFVTPPSWSSATEPPQQQQPELRYQFPLHDGVSVVAFTATIYDPSLPSPRVIRGVVQEKGEARQNYNDAVAAGKAAGLLEMTPEAADVFVTKLGNIPAATKVVVEVQYLGELKHDAGVDGLRLTIPMGIAPRFGDWPGDILEAYTPVLSPSGVAAGSSSDEDKSSEHGLKITIDAQLPPSAQIQSISSPSHQIAVSIGKTSTSSAAQTLVLNQASATLALNGTSAVAAHLDKDFILHLTATSLSTPQAVLEKHPTIPDQHALMATFVPKFSLSTSSPSSKKRSKPEVIFLCDRSGSMSSEIPNLISALRVFIKSLPQGVRFNIASFGSRYSFLWPPTRSSSTSGSRLYARDCVAEAMRHVEDFAADYGGTEMYQPMEAIFDQWARQHAHAVRAAGGEEDEDDENRDLEVFLLTDGEIWQQDQLFELIERNVRESRGHIRVFSLGIGSGASSSLVEGVARVGNGFSQSVADGEDMSGKVVRMVKGAMFEHVKDYRVEIKYGAAEVAGNEDEAMSQGGAAAGEDEDDGFEMVEKVEDAMVIDQNTPASAPPAYTATTKTESASEDTHEHKRAKISLFDETSTMSTDLPNHDDLPQSSASAAFANIAPCPPPSILQTPYEIPPLFPFNRTTVCFLFNKAFPTNKHSQPLVPKTVVLRGTTLDGTPLELEIPVSVLPEPGETIHQLAARRAVQELEQGKGWMYNARKHPKGNTDKDTNKDGDGQDSDLLRTATPAPDFQAMVQREAVRLGVTFQVGGGKWSSFVAVEETVPSDSNDDGVNKKDKLTERYVHDPNTNPAAKEHDRGRLVGGHAMFQQQFVSQGQTSVAMAAADLGSSRSAMYSSSEAFSISSPRSKSTLSSLGNKLRSLNLLGSPSAFVPSSAGSIPPPPPPGGRENLRLYSAVPPPAAPAPAPAFAFASAAAAPRRHVGAKRYRKFAVSTPDSAPKDEEHEEEDDDAEEVVVQEQTSISETPDTPREKFDALVRLQGFDGAWKWEHVLEVFGWSEEEVVAAWGDSVSKKITDMDASEKAVLATALVVAWLRTEMGAQKDSWELLVDKAVERLAEDDTKALQDNQKDRLDDFLVEVEKVVKRFVKQ